MTVDLAETVRTAWCETLDAPGVERLSWHAAGGDSLATLHLLYRLEQALGRELPFDLLEPETTVAGLVEALKAFGDAPAPGRPTIFLIPGLYGDEPGLAAFRYAVRGCAQFELVPLPGLDDRAAVLRDMCALGAAAAARILARQPDGPLYLAGYSIGGSVAFETAAQLAAAGRQVALVAVLDGVFGRTVLGPERWPLRRRWRHRGGRLLARLAAWDRARRPALAAAARLLPDGAHDLRRAVIRVFRTEARMAWSPAPVAAPCLIALSTDFADANRPVWLRLCAAPTLIELQAGHTGIFRGEALDRLGAAFERAIAAAG